MIRTPICDLIDIEHPIALGGMGSATSDRHAPEHAVRKGWDFKLAKALDCSVSDLRQADSVASSKRWRRAWLNLSDAPLHVPAARRWNAEE
jgi:hypothetical protein